MAKISAFSSKNLLEKYEYLTGEDLGKTKFNYSPLGMSLSKSFKKDNVKNISNRESDFNYDSKYKFYRFYKQHDEFEEMSLDSKQNKIKEFKRLVKPLKQETQLEINKKRFNEILSTVTKAKNEGLRINVDGRRITLDNTESLLKVLGNGILNRHEFKNRYNNIVDDIEAIVNKPKITRNQ